jgi:hypothetical protein
MIIVKLKGGLGNQMFQYARGRRLSLLHKVQLKLDTTWFDNMGNDTAREYGLKNFKINEEFASFAEINALSGGGHFLNEFRRFLPLRMRSYIQEKQLNFEAAALNLHDNVYLNGVWANEKYFLDIRQLITEEFQLKYPSDIENIKMVDYIHAVNSVAVHVRRGDYVSNPVTNNYHGVCTTEFYNCAIAAIAAKINNPYFFLFSDDPQWVKENIIIPFPTIYVTHNSSGKAYEDLNLMRNCKHNIIANSSFSWWGAWLNSNPEKIIYAPSRWSNNSVLNNNTFLPAAWNTI